jgi:hypothetical protein
MMLAAWQCQLCSCVLSCCPQPQARGGGGHSSHRVACWERHLRPLVPCHRPTNQPAVFALVLCLHLLCVHRCVDTTCVLHLLCFAAAAAPVAGLPAPQAHACHSLAGAWQRPQWTTTGAPLVFVDGVSEGVRGRAVTRCAHCSSKLSLRGICCRSVVQPAQAQLGSEKRVSGQQKQSDAQWYSSSSTHIAGTSSTETHSVSAVMHSADSCMLDC